MSDATNFPLSNPDLPRNVPDELFSESLSTSVADAATSIVKGRRSDVASTAEQPQRDRRRRRRALISTPVRVRGIHVTENGPDEISTTIDVSRGGILFATQNTSFYPGMELAVTFPYCSAPGAVHAEQRGCVARIHVLPDGRRAIAVALGVGVGVDLVDSCGQKLDKNPVRVGIRSGAYSNKPLILAVDADDLARENLKSYLTSEGYHVIAVSNGSDARSVLEMFTPALLIAEVEGEDLPGFDLCAFVKGSAELKKVPVLLTTRSGNPTDYSNAHSLGAVVCMAKPYKQDRLGHVVRLLAPPASANECATPPRPPDLSRRFCNGNTSKATPGTNGSRRFRFPSFR